MSYICDENIVDDAFDYLIAKGEKIKHVKRDYGVEGDEDSSIMSLAKRVKATLITANTKHFKSSTFVDDSIVRNSYGVIMLTSSIPADQIKMYYRVKKEKNLNTLNKRKNKRIIVNKGKITATDVTNKREEYVTFKW